MALEKVPAVEQCKLELGYRRQSWKLGRCYFIGFSTGLPPAVITIQLKENGSKSLETNTNCCHIPNSFQGSKSPSLLGFILVASSVFRGPELFSCVLQPHSSLHRLCPQQHLKALLCWLLYKCAARHRNYLLQWSLGLSCLKWKVQTVGLKTALQHWKVRGSANRISRCCNLLPFWSGYTRKLARK